VNLKLLTAKMRRRLSLTDSLAELLVLTDLEIEMAARVSGGGELAFPESNHKEE